VTDVSNRLSVLSKTAFVIQLEQPNSMPSFASLEGKTE